MGLFICIGIGAGISTDVAIGDVCYTGTLIDVSDNSKITERPGEAPQLSLAPTTYETPRALVTPIGLDRVSPATKPAHQAWVAERGRLSEKVIPGEFRGRSGKKQRIQPPRVWEGAIVCGIVSDSAAYNDKIRSVHRKVLALETESGGMFSITDSAGIPAMTVRGISDYAGAGIDKTTFEEETDNKARKVATVNAVTFLVRQLQSISVRGYLEKLRAASAQPSLLAPLPTETLTEFLIGQDEEFYAKLRDLSPAFSLLAKGYRLPLPRIRILDRPGIEKRSRYAYADLQELLQTANVVTLHIPREYPDSSIAMDYRTHFVVCSIR